MPVATKEEVAAGVSRMLRDLAEEFESGAIEPTNAIVDAEITRAPNDGTGKMEAKPTGSHRLTVTWFVPAEQARMQEWLYGLATQMGGLPVPTETINPL